MPLQADPTVIYALKLKSNDFDQVIKRVFINLTMASPYNTYMNTGLLQARFDAGHNGFRSRNKSWNDFIYFCASVERFGYHEFAATLKEHNVNAKNIQIGLLPKA
jgi:UPF0755 protein